MFFVKQGVVEILLLRSQKVLGVQTSARLLRRITCDLARRITCGSCASARW